MPASGPSRGTWHASSCMIVPPRPLCIVQVAARPQKFARYQLWRRGRQRGDGVWRSRIELASGERRYRLRRHNLVGECIWLGPLMRCACGLRRSLAFARSTGGTGHWRYRRVIEVFKRRLLGHPATPTPHTPVATPSPFMRHLLTFGPTFS